MRTKFLFTPLLVILFFHTNAQRPFFDNSTDILIAQFDSKPDPDDIHSQAALGCMLHHPDFAEVNYYAVAGAIGEQNGPFIDSDDLFDLAFGNENWTDADDDYWASVAAIKNKVVPILQNGGKVWVQEAGQSDITAEWLFQVLDEVPEETVKNNVIVVQHSNWNEDQSTDNLLDYVKDKASYYEIDDGNAGINQAWGDRGPWDTPQYRSQNTSFLTNALNSPNQKANDMWNLAIQHIEAVYPGGFDEPWSWITGGGLDYSDCVENWWIFDLGTEVDNVDKFWNRYVINEVTSSVSPLEKKPFIHIFPNPANGNETVHFAFEQMEGRKMVYVYNLQGQRLLDLETFENRISIDASEFTRINGTYLVRVESSDKKYYSTKIIVKEF